MRTVGPAKLLGAVILPCTLALPFNSSAQGRSLEETEQQPEQRTLHLLDAGRRFEVGELWDERSGQVVGGRLWREAIMAQNTYVTNASWTSVDVAHDDSIRSKRRLMGISAELALKVQLNPGTLDLHTSFRYLTDKRRTSKSVRLATSVQTRTIKEKLDIYSDSMMANLNPQVLGVADRCKASSAIEEECRKATHVVTSVTYGADVYAIFENTYLDQYDRKRMYSYLQFKLGIPMGFDIDFETEFLQNQMVHQRYNRTRVQIFGDLALKRHLPTTLEDALAFMRAIPEESDTLIGKGVAMEVALTPIAWLHHDAARLMQEINADTVERLTDIYEAFDESEALITDLVDTEHAGFRAWKASADAYHADFNRFRSNFSANLFSVMQQFQSGYVNQMAMQEAENSYLDSPFTAASVQAEVERRLDQITNLMAQVALFEDAGVIFAHSVSSFFAPTFDQHFDRVYGLVLVGLDPSSDRDGIKRVRDFVNLARQRQVAEGVSEHPQVKHCVQRREVGSNATVQCVETLAFVAVHFESHCLSFCKPGFCSLNLAGAITCPATADVMPPCWLSAEDAETLQCRINDHRGKCGEDDAHHIDNYRLKPISDCWCACPRTQILEYYHSSSAQGLHSEMPRAPTPPKILAVHGHDNPEPLPNRQVMFVEVNTSFEDGARNYRVLLLWSEVQQEGTLITHQEKQLAIETPGRRQLISIRNLLAGREYWLEVQGISSNGIGKPTAIPGKFLVAHRMATLTFPTNNGYTHDFNTGPLWVDQRVSIMLSTRAFDELARVSLHTTFIAADQIDNVANDRNDSTELLLGEDCKAATATSISCQLLLSKISKDPLSGLVTGLPTTAGKVEIQVRVWDVSGVLAALSSVWLAKPSREWCARYGSKRLYCPINNRCVDSCVHCEHDSVPTAGECIVSLCPANTEIWCPARDECIHKTARPDDACRYDCLDDDGKGGRVQSIAGVETCLSACNVQLPEQFSQGLVQRGDELFIDCAAPYNLKRGLPAIFTCPTSSLTKEDVSYIYDAHAVLGHINRTELPVCEACSTDQIWDVGMRKCRHLRPSAAGSNYIVNGDFEHFHADGAPMFFEVVAMPGVAAHRPGAGGVGTALELRDIASTELALVQVMRLQHLNRSEASSGHDVPPVDSIWQASLLSRSISGNAAAGAAPLQMCLRDRNDAGTTSKSCVDLASSAGLQWQRAELQFKVSDGAELLALDVWGGAGHVLIDHLAVFPVDGFAESVLSPRDIKEDVRRELEERFRAVERQVETLQNSTYSKGGVDAIVAGIEHGVDELKGVVDEKANKQECRMCMSQRGWHSGCHQCSCGTFCSGWAGGNSLIGSKTKSIVDDTHNRAGGCVREYWLECRPSQ